MSKIEPMTVVAVAIMPDGSTRLDVQGRSSLADLMLASKHLDLEVSHAFGRMKAQQAMQQPQVVGATLLPTNGRG